MLGTNVETTSFGNEHLKWLLGYIVAPHQWNVVSRDELSRLFAKALEGYYTGSVTMMKAVVTLFQYRHDGPQVIPGADVQHVNYEHRVGDEGTVDSVIGSNNVDLNDIESAPIEALLDYRDDHGFIPRPLRLGSIYGLSHVGIRARPLSFQPGIGLMSAQKTLEEKKRKRNSTGSVGMSEWIAQLHTGANPYVEKEVMESVAEIFQDTERMSPPFTPTTPSLTYTSCSTSSTSTPPTTPPDSPSPVFRPKRPLTEVNRILSAFPVPPSAVQWKVMPVSLPGHLETIVEDAPATSRDRRRRARCSYNGGKNDIVVAPTIPQELLSEEIGVAC